VGACNSVSIYTSVMSKPYESVSVKAVAILGAGGTMGGAMARNAAAADLPVKAWNRTAAKLDDLAAVEGVETFTTPREAVIGADIVVTMLSDADATVAAMSGPDGGAAGSEGAAWVQMGTIGVDGAERCAALARDRGLEYVDAPVLGTKKPAEDGLLVVLASGAEAPRDRLEPFFDAVGRRTMWLGAAGEGSKLKVVINSWICTMVEGTAEMLRLAEGLGLEPHLVLDAIEEGPLEAPYMRVKGEAMLRGDFTPSFRLALAAKDARLAAEAGEAAGAPIPLIEAVAERFTAVAAEHPDQDLAAVFRGTADD
jgi:3-hydroxyisobutyrate dehydrogenase